jgi:long-chain acyl-CoA synthetase
MTPIEALDGRARMRPKDIAFLSKHEIWTYSRLVEQVHCVAQALVAHGVREGDRVALHMPNLPELAACYYGCLRVGAIACPLNIRMKFSELRPLLGRLRPSLYIGQAQLYAHVAETEPEILQADSRIIVGGHADGCRSWAELLETSHSAVLPRGAGDNMPAVLLTTSGTTGVPKFVTHTQATLAAVPDAWAHLGLRPEDVVLHCLPMVHSSGLYTFMSCVHHGAQMVLLEQFDANEVLDAIACYRCSWLLGLPFMFAALMESQRASPRRVESLRMCVTAGDVCPVELQQEFPHMFGVPLRSFWAATETVATTYSTRFGPVSRVTPGMQVRLVDDNDTPVDRGEVGELLVRGANVTVGYWNGPDHIDAIEPDGWFRTGDLMRHGEGDDLWFVGRKKDLIIRGGSNISPVEVENALKTHPAVCDAAAFGVSDPILGQRVAALVVLSDDATAVTLNELRASAMGKLADYKVPERLKRVSSIPRNALGKIDRKSLQSLL